MIQYQVYLEGTQTMNRAIRHIHANSIQEAGEKALKHYKGCEILDVKKIKSKIGGKYV